MGQRIKVIIADDHPVILFGAAQALLKFPEIEVIGQARQSTELIQLLQKSPCDVVVSDLAMPGGNLAAACHCWVISAVSFRQCASSC
jgi:two-component system, NarL family, captular synthesis response regulator RcsB